MELLIIYLLYAVMLSFGLWRNGLQSKVSVINHGTGKGKKILVIGATGGTGQELVRQALERDYEVSALVRNLSKLKIEHPNLKVLKGDVLDYNSVEAGMHGQDVVLSALGHKRFFYPTRILSEGTRNILQAMEVENVQRLICETSLGIGNSAGKLGLYYTFFTIPVILPFYFWDKTRQEKLIAESNTKWCIVRPGKLTKGAKTNEYRHGPEIGNFFWTVRITRADVASFMIDQITDNTYLGMAVAVSRK